MDLDTVIFCVIIYAAVKLIHLSFFLVTNIAVTEEIDLQFGSDRCKSNLLGRASGRSDQTVFSSVGKFSFFMSCMYIIAYKE